MIKISVVIPTFNRKELLEECLTSLLVQTYPKENFEIIIVDDGSSDNTEKLVKTVQRKNPHLKYVRHSHAGVASSTNCGIKIARGEIIALTDDDCLPGPTWLEKIDRAFRRNPKALGIEGKTITDKACVDLFTLQVVNETGGWYFTCNMAYKKRALKDVGGFDEHFRFTHCEDLDISRQILKRGKIVFCPEVLVAHSPRKTSFFSGLKKITHLSDEFYLYKKNQEYFFRFFRLKNELLVYLQVLLLNHIWYRIRLLKDSFKDITKNPFLWLKFFAKMVMEMSFVTIIFPKAVWETRKWKT